MTYNPFMVRSLAGKPQKSLAGWRFSSVLATLIALGIIASGSVQANTLLVRKDGSGNYTTIQAAVNAMAARDTVLVGPGTYAERITLPSGKSGIAGSLTTVMAETQGTVETQGFDTGNCNYLRIQGFNVSVPTNSTNPGFSLRSSHLEIVSNYVHDVLTHGIRGFGELSANHIAGNHIANMGYAMYYSGYELARRIQRP